MTDSHAKKEMQYQTKNIKQKSCVLIFIGCGFFV